MEPYTKEGVTRKESDQLKSAAGSSTGSSSSASQRLHEPMRVVTDNQRYYELVGVVVHSGQASAGHYYSYIKNRQYVLFVYCSFNINLYFRTQRDLFPRVADSFLYYFYTKLI